MASKLAPVREILVRYAARVSSLSSENKALQQRLSQAEELQEIALQEFDSYKSAQQQKESQQSADMEALQIRLRSQQEKEAQLQADIDALESEMQSLLSTVEESGN
jgi:SMC interacting uncharacterized protein involved in chromosome segregation